MKTRTMMVTPALALAFLVMLALGTTAQVATLRTPGPGAEASEPPSEEVDGQEAILQFVACLRDNGIDIPDPQFGVEGGFFGGGGGGDLAGVDFMSSEFLDAMEACQSLLEALQPEIDPEQQAEQNEQLLVFAECMRREGIDFPDPDPIRGLSIGAMRGDDGELMFDPFASDFQEASGVCAAEIGLEPPEAPGAQP